MNHRVPTAGVFDTRFCLGCRHERHYSQPRGTSLIIVEPFLILLRSLVARAEDPNRYCVMDTTVHLSRRQC